MSKPMSYERLIPIIGLWIEYTESIPKAKQPGTFLTDDQGNILNVSPTIEGFMNWLRAKVEGATHE